jgi:hypothetical protein
MEKIPSFNPPQKAQLQSGAPGQPSLRRPMQQNFAILILTSWRNFSQNSLEQNLDPGEGASPDSVFPRSDLQSQN